MVLTSLIGLACRVSVIHLFLGIFTKPPTQWALMPVTRINTLSFCNFKYFIVFFVVFVLKLLLHFILGNKIKCYSPPADVRLSGRLFKICGQHFQLDYTCHSISGTECSRDLKAFYEHLIVHLLYFSLIPVLLFIFSHLF